MVVGQCVGADVVRDWDTRPPRDVDVKSFDEPSELEHAPVP